VDELKTANAIAVSGMNAQSRRLRVVAENMANADSLPQAPGAEPYRRKIVTFKTELDKETGANKVQVSKVSQDQSQLSRKYDPSHPAADREGYVLAPNVNPLIELMDMREAQRSYEANMNVINASKAMLSKTIDMLR
jgi:flagellar basal-body rod protein FlgC